MLGVIRRNGKYLLTKRVHKDPKFHGAWQIAGGGLEFGETLVEGMRREIKEELNLSVKNPRMIPRIFEVVRPQPKWHGVFVAFLCDLASPELVIKLDEEASDWRWFKASEIFRHHKNYLLKTDEVIKEAEKL